MILFTLIFVPSMLVYLIIKLIYAMALKKKFINLIELLFTVVIIGLVGWIWFATESGVVSSYLNDSASIAGEASWLLFLLSPVVLVINVILIIIYYSVGFFKKKSDAFTPLLAFILAIIAFIVVSFSPIQKGNELLKIYANWEPGIAVQLRDVSDKEIIKYLDGKDVNAKIGNRNLLELAMDNGHFETVDYLVSKGADPQSYVRKLMEKLEKDDYITCYTGKRALFDYLKDKSWASPVFKYENKIKKLLKEK